MNDSIHTRRSRLTTIALIGCYAVLALLLTSWDSYLYDLWQHHDVIWFYMCGKAWMSGMTPYVDFADSKGPLLWLIYGIGYLLRPHDYVGMYWIACVLYTFIFYQCYKCAALFVGAGRLALMAVVLSSLFFLSTLTHIEVRAEDYCYALMLPVFYRFLRFNVCKESDAAFVRQTAIVLGVALGGTMLIKYSCTLMLAIFIPYCCVVMPRRCHYPVLKALGWCALAGVACLLPMAGWLAWKGCLGDCVHEYFLVTASTFDNMHGTSITAGQVAGMFLGRRVIVFTIAVVACVVIYWAKVKRGKWFVALALLWFMGVIFLNGTDRIYLNVLSLFTVVAMGIIVRAMARWLRRWWLQGVLTAGVLAGLFAMTDHLSLFSTVSLDQRIWDYYPTLLSQYDSPRLLYLMCHDHGEGVPVHGLPACKYWSLQVGYTPQMLADQVACVKRQGCDAAFVESDNQEMIELLEANGYHRHDFTDTGMGDKSWKRYLMYTNKQLTPSSGIVPSPVDVLLKRNLFNVK